MVLVLMNMNGVKQSCLVMSSSSSCAGGIAKRVSKPVGEVFADSDIEEVSVSAYPCLCESVCLSVCLCVCLCVSLCVWAGGGGGGGGEKKGDLSFLDTSTSSCQQLLMLINVIVRVFLKFNS